MIVQGHTLVVGDGVGVTDLVPARYDKAGMSRDWQECSLHVLEDVRPGAVARMAAGDILVAGDGLGSGHAHYFMTAIMGCVAAGFSAVIADSVNALFLRAAVDAGVPVWALPGISRVVADGDELRVNLGTGRVENLTEGTVHDFPAASPLVLDILRAGGSEPWAIQSLAENKPT